MADDILIAKHSGMFYDADGQVVRVRRGKTTIRKGHPLLKGREDMFEPLSVTFDLPVRVRGKAKA